VTGSATWRSRMFALAVALTVNLIILLPVLTTKGRNLWTTDVQDQRDAIITFTPQKYIDGSSIHWHTSPSHGTRTPSLTKAINRPRASAYAPLVPDPLPRSASTLAPAFQPAIASSPTADVSAAVRKALQGLAACSASRSPLGAPEQRESCQRQYATAPGGLTSAAFINPLKRARFDSVAQAQEAKRATLQGPIPDGYVACTGVRSNAMFACPSPPRSKTPAANLWEASAPSTNPRGDP
jgi:hypothetical protein